MADRVGFEPTIRLLVYTLSKRALRTSRIEIYYLISTIYTTAAAANQIINHLSIFF